MADERGLLKLPVLTKESDYLSWKRRIYAYLRRSDPALVAFAPRPAEDSDDFIDWFEKSTKGKSGIVLPFVPFVTAKRSEIIDNDKKTAKDLWDELARLHTTTSTQAILNLK